MRITHSFFMFASLSFILSACNPPAPVEEEPETMSMTFEELMDLDEDYTCTFTQQDGELTTSGTVYVSAGSERLRGDFTVTGEESSEAHVIHTDSTTYVWSSEFESGIKMKLAEGDSIFGDDDSGEIAGIERDEAVDFVCADWDVDVSVFALPAGVEFQDMSAMMDGLMQMGEMDVQMQCAACDQIPDTAAQAQCRSALGC